MIHDTRTHVSVNSCNVNLFEFQSELPSWENINSNRMNKEMKERTLHQSQKHNFRKKEQSVYTLYKILLEQFLLFVELIEMFEYSTL